jgi:hypothetical protein
MGSKYLDCYDRHSGPVTLHISPSLSTAPALLGAVAFGRSVLPPEHTTRLFRGGSELSSKQAVQVSYSGWGFRILDRRTEMRAASKAP